MAASGTYLLLKCLCNAALFILLSVYFIFVPVKRKVRSSTSFEPQSVSVTVISSRGDVFVIRLEVVDAEAAV